MYARKVLESIHDERRTERGRETVREYNGVIVSATNMHIYRVLDVMCSGMIRVWNREIESSFLPRKQNGSDSRSDCVFEILAGEIFVTIKNNTDQREKVEYKQNENNTRHYWRSQELHDIYRYILVTGSSMKSCQKHVFDNVTARLCIREARPSLDDNLRDHEVIKRTTLELSTTQSQAESLIQ